MGMSRMSDVLVSFDHITTDTYRYYQEAENEKTTVGSKMMCGVSLRCGRFLVVATLAIGFLLQREAHALTATRAINDNTKTFSSSSSSSSSSLSLLSLASRVRKPTSCSKRKKERSATQLDVRYRKSYHDDNDEEERAYDGRARQRSTDRPTQTTLDVIGPPIIPAKPKIVVLGASGRIGRLVVKQLLEMKSVDMTIVALVRDYDKAVKVLYDDGEFAAARSSKKGPKLQIVQGDLVPPEDLPGFAGYDPDEEEVWLAKAESASKFYDGTTVKDYDNRDDLPDINESLEYAIKHSTTIISCVGSVRPTNIWTDVLARPFTRLLRPDVSRWCNDNRHPYYVHYASTRKALGYAEREQLRREAAAEAIEEERMSDEKISVPKIRFIRISDLCVSQKPWDFVPLLTNIMRSVVFRYQEMAEQLLDQSALVETVVLRPGDLVDEERDVNATSLQVCSSGTVPQPARVGREDVASLAVAAAMFTTTTDGKKKTQPSQLKHDEPFHYTLACRWVGEGLEPYPAQGRKGEGKSDAQTALHDTLKKLRREEKHSSNQRRRKELSQKSKQLLGGDEVVDEIDSPGVLLRLARQKLAQRCQRKRPKPHGLCVAIPTYFFLFLCLKTLIIPLLHVIPGGKTWGVPIIQNLNEKFNWIMGLLIGQLRRIGVPHWILSRPKQYVLL